MTAPDSYLEKFPVEHRNSVNRAYEDGYLDGINDQYDDEPPTITPCPWLIEVNYGPNGKIGHVSRWHRLSDDPRLATKQGASGSGMDGLIRAIREAALIQLVREHDRGQSSQPIRIELTLYEGLTND